MCFNDKLCRLTDFVDLYVLYSLFSREDELLNRNKNPINDLPRITKQIYETILL